MGMDKLEQRLNQLKNSYEEVPTASNPANIMESIKKSEIKKKKKKKWVVQLPYVASFIGVLIIGSLLAVQMLSSQGSNQGDGEKKPEEKPPVTEEKVTEEEILEKHKELENFYYEQMTMFQQNTDFTIPDNLPYFNEVKALVDKTADPAYKKYRNAKDLEESFEEYKRIVQNSFELSKIDLEQLPLSSKEDLSSDVMDIIHKQEGIRPLYINQLKGLSEKLNTLSNDFLEQLNKLNTLQIEDQELLEFATSIKENGYYFKDLEGQLEITVNYQSYIDKHDDRLSQEVKDFINLQNKPVAVDGYLQESWEGLADRIVEMERIRNNYEGSSKVIMDNEFYNYINLYLNDIANPPSFAKDGTLVPELKVSYEKFLREQDPNTEAYKRIQEHYNTLKEGNFNKSALQ